MTESKLYLNFLRSNLSNQNNSYLQEKNKWESQLNIKESTFRIVQSSLGVTEFIECSLQKFRFEYSNSKINSIFITGGSVPKDIIVLGSSDKLEKVEQTRTFNNQLKNVFEKQGDVVRGLFYHTKASENQMTIAWEEGDFKEWVARFLNRLSNSHGRNWILAIIFILISSHIGFYL